MTDWFPPVLEALGHHIRRLEDENRSHRRFQTDSIFLIGFLVGHLVKHGVEVPEEYHRWNTRFRGGGYGESSELLPLDGTEQGTGALASDNESESDREDMA